MKFIQQIKNNNKNITEYALSMLVCALAFMMWCFDTVSYQGDKYALLQVVFSGLAVIVYCIAIKRVNIVIKDDIRIIRQVQIINGCMLAATFCILLSDIVRSKGSICNVISGILWLIVEVYTVYCHKPYIRLEDIPGSIKKIICENKEVCLLLCIFLILGLAPFRLQFRWDGALYEQACRLMNIHSLSSLGAYGHLSQAYGSLYYLLWSIVGNTQYAMVILNIALYLLSIIGIYLFTNRICDGIHKTSMLLITLMYASSPYLLGMVNYYSLDYMATCTFIWVVYFAYSNKWILHFAVAICFVFTKEPSIVVYGAFCVGVLIIDIIENGIKACVCRYRYYSMVAVAVFWVVLYSLIGGWSGGEGQFAIDGTYVVNKLKALYILNFNWLILILSIVCAVILIIKRQNGKGLKLCLPIILSMIGYTLFSILFKTVNHARYTAAVPVGLYLIFVIVLSNLKQTRLIVKNALLVIVSICMLLSSYMTFDPVSLYCFENVSTGNGRMLTTGDYAIGDSMIYNKQMLGEENAFNMALSYAVNKGYDIYIPMYGDNSYSFDGLMTETKITNRVQTKQYWNYELNRRSAYSEEQSEAFILNEIKTASDIGDDQNYNNRCYIYSEILGSEIADKIVQNYKDVQTKEFNYGVWKLYMIEF